ncbi:MAG: hypothetical protein WAT93_13845 [Pontixanthobacter sp.]
MSAIHRELPDQPGLSGVIKHNFPKTMEVDGVRVWQCGANAATASVCILELG